MRVREWLAAIRTEYPRQKRRDGSMRYQVSSNTTLGMLRCALVMSSLLPIAACGNEWDDAVPGEVPDNTIAEVSQALTGTWTALVNPPPANLDTCMLLT